MKEKQTKRELEETASCSESSVISRRKFMSRGALVVGAAGATVAATGGLGLLSGSLAGAQTSPPTCATVPGTVRHPRGTWGYTTLDPAACGERAYQGFWGGKACCWGVMDGVMGMLQDMLGSPYTNIDLASFGFGGAGVNGWGTLCGTELGAALVVNMIVGKVGTVDVGKQLSNDLIAYYSQTSLPTYVPVNSLYLAKGGAVAATNYYMDAGTGVSTIPTSAADSPLCHISVSKWLIAANAAAAADPLSNPGYAIPINAGHAERKERCARLAGTMAYKAAELLNDWQTGTYTPGAWGGAGSNPTNEAPSQNNCLDCHTP